MLNSILIEGLIYGIMVLGVFSTFRVLNFCDMTVDGSFPLGACVLAACLTAGIPPVAAIFIAFLSGLVAGIATSAIYTNLKIPDLLAGILDAIFSQFEDHVQQGKHFLSEDRNTFLKDPGQGL